MARYFAIHIECYDEEATRRICAKLEKADLSHLGENIRLHGIEAILWKNQWSVIAYPHGFLHVPESINRLRLELFSIIASEKGIRRAVCGYEAQEYFQYDLEPDQTDDFPDLLFHKDLDKNVGSRSGLISVGEDYFLIPSDPSNCSDYTKLTCVTMGCKNSTVNAIVDGKLGKQPIEIVTLKIESPEDIKGNIVRIDFYPRHNGIFDVALKTVGNTNEFFGAKKHVLAPGKLLFRGSIFTETEYISLAKIWNSIPGNVTM